MSAIFKGRTQNRQRKSYSGLMGAKLGGEAVATGILTAGALGVGPTAGMSLPAAVGVALTLHSFKRQLGMDETVLVKKGYGKLRSWRKGRKARARRRR